MMARPISIFSVNTTGNQNTTGNAATATKLATARNINGVKFDGSGDININTLVSRGRVTALSGSTQGAAGIQMYEAYHNSYPTTYGNVLHMKGASAAGEGELLIGWSGTSGAHAPVFIRSRRDTTDAAWSEWAQVYTSKDSIPGVNTTGNQNTTGNAASATKLQTARTIGGVSFNGTANIDLPGVNKTGNQSTTGNAATATKLQTARTIGGVSFDGSANINLPGVNTTGNQNTTGNAATATKLATARNINGVKFDGSGDININTLVSRGRVTALSGSTQGAAGIQMYEAYNNSYPTTYGNVLHMKGASAAGEGELLIGWSGTSGAHAPVFIRSRRDYTGAAWSEWAQVYTSKDSIPGVNTTGNQNTTGNAASATTLQTARTIGGVSFDGSANIDLPGVNKTGNQSTTGNAATATKLQTARTIGGVSFDGSANINLPGVNIAGNQNTTGNAATATKLQTACTINGVSFDGSKDIELNPRSIGTINSTTMSFSGGAGWFKLATVTMPQASSVVYISLIGGAGFNVGAPQQAGISELVLRAGNGNPKGITGALWRRTSVGFTNFAWVNTSGDTYDIYVEIGNYATGVNIQWDYTKDATVQIHTSPTYTANKPTGLTDGTVYVIYSSHIKPTAADVGALSLSGGQLNGALGIGTSSALGGNSIVLGDNDTGFKQNGDGNLDVYANNVHVMRFVSGSIQSNKTINITGRVNPSDYGNFDSRYVRDIRLGTRVVQTMQKG